MTEKFEQEADKELKTECEIYHSNGTITYDLNDQSNTICAKLIRYPNLNVTRWYVKRYGCEFFDPQHISLVYKRHPWKMGPVSETAFNLYLLYLGFKDGSGKGKKYLKVRAERLV